MTDMVPKVAEQVDLNEVEIQLAYINCLYGIV